MDKKLLDQLENLPSEFQELYNQFSSIIYKQRGFNHHEKAALQMCLIHTFVAFQSEARKTPEDAVF